MAGKLTAIGAKALVKPGRYSDGGGLHLHVRAPERRAWVLRYTRQGKTRDMGLGAFPEVSLAEARKMAEAARVGLRQGIDPVAARARPESSPGQAAGPTFQAAAEEHIATHRESWRHPKHAAQWVSTLSSYVYPLIGSMPVKEIEVSAVLSVLRPIWIRAPETASRVRGRIEAVLEAARARGWRSGENPARWKGNLAGLLPAQSVGSRVEHQPALPWQQVAAFMTELRSQAGVGPRALEFLILTAARTAEVRGATWAEINLEEAVWTVPGGRMKAGRTHRVPLSGPTVSLLQGLLPLRATALSWVFPGSKGKQPLSDMTLSAIIRRMNEAAALDPPKWRGDGGRAIVPHGFRSTFRVWAGEETAHAREVVEAALAHTVRNRAEAAYARTDLLERRRPLMEEWAKVCQECHRQTTKLNK